MNLLLLGGGGREHAIAWKLSQSPRCTRLFIAPGNSGTASCGVNVDLSPLNFEQVKTFCVDEHIDMVIVGPEEPLVKGIVDSLADDPRTAAIPVIGPSREGAQLEGSKSFAKRFMQRHGIPTAAYREFDADSYSEGIPYLEQHRLPIVLKADGLAAGKGVIICQTHEEAVREFELMTRQNKFGEAGRKVVVEEFLDGIELSVFLLTDGENHVVLPEAKDYKRIGEGDTGPNTGGMGAVSPVPFADDALMQKIRDRIILPTIAGLKKDEIRYRGFVFLGLIKVGDDPLVIEYNCRLGDPETEVVIPRLKNDLVELLEATAAGTLQHTTLETDPRVATTVMAVSGGYPGAYQTGFVIRGLADGAPGSSEKASAKSQPESPEAAPDTPGSLVFHAGAETRDGEVVTSGGRVLAVTSFGNSIADAVAQSNKAMEQIQFDGMYYRRDIGWEFYQ